MEVFEFVLVLMLIAAVFALVAASIQKDKQADVEPDDT